MFAHLTNFAYKRTALQAVGFYIAYFLLLLLIAGATGGFLALATGNVDQDLSIRIGVMISVIACAILSVRIAQKKQMLHHFPALLSIILAIIGAMFGGALVGLVFVAYLTTKPVESTRKNTVART